MRILFRAILTIGISLLLSFATNQYIIPDEYSITNEMLKDARKERNIDGVFSFDKAWFKNNDLEEILVFELYTDYYRSVIYHCQSNFLFHDFIKNIELNKKVNNQSFDLAEESNKQQVFKKFFDDATQIDKRYFITKQGLKLGLDKKLI